MTTEKRYNVAIVGATGAVGTALLDILAERDFPVAELYVIASEESVASTVMFKGKSLTIEALSGFDFADADIAFFTAGSEVTAAFSSQAATANCAVVDLSGYFSEDARIPQVVYEVNPETLTQFRPGNIVASPDSAVIALLMVIKPIWALAGITSLTVTTFEPVSGVGKRGVSELAAQTAKLLNGQQAETHLFPGQIAFNVIPQCGELNAAGFSRDELRLAAEVRRVLQADDLCINPTRVRVPVFYGVSAAIQLQTKAPVAIATVKQVLSAAPGLRFVDTDDDGEIATPQADATGQDEVFVARLRQGLDSDQSLNLWITSDNVRKGAALNGVQLAELLIKSYL